jgi:hypothetical protein
MFPENRLSMSKITLVPTHHDAASAIDCPSAIAARLLHLVQEIVGNTDVIRMAELIL